MTLPGRYRKGSEVMPDMNLLYRKAGMEDIEILEIREQRYCGPRTA